MTEQQKILVAPTSAFIDVTPEPVWRSLLRFTLVTAACIAIFLVLLALGVERLMSLDFEPCALIHGADLDACLVREYGN